MNKWSLFSGITFLFAASQASTSSAADSQCRTTTMPDNLQVILCKDSAGHWRQSEAQNNSASEVTAGEFPARAEVTYRGTWNASATIAQPINANNLSLGGLLNSMMNTGTVNVGGKINIIEKISGQSVTFTVSGDNITTETLQGTMQGGTCKFSGLKGVSSTIYEGPCDKNGFSGNLRGVSSEGHKFKGTFETQTVELVDLDERDRRAANEEAENKSKEATAAAQLAAKPNASTALAKALEAAVKGDSSAWTWNKYDIGSMKNVKVLQAGNDTTIRGQYTYNGGSDGWVEARVRLGKIQCLSYWDNTPCSPVRSPPQGTASQKAQLGAKTANGFVEIPYIWDENMDINNEIRRIAKYFPRYIEIYTKTNTLQ